MSHRVANALHTIIVGILFLGTIVAVTWLGHYLAGMRGLRGNAMTNWMSWWFGGGLLAGAAVFMVYRRLFLRGLAQALSRVEHGDADRRHEEIIARIKVEQEALREQLRATPGLERYAEIIGRSTIGSVEDARRREARVAALRSDPVTAKYSERVFKGEHITDAMIAYWEDPAARVLCAHLRALEADVRAANPEAYPSAPGTLESQRRFDFEAVKRDYRLDAPVTFWLQPFGPRFHGRGEDEYEPEQRISCTEHGCTLRGSENLIAFQLQPKHGV